jgi:hypothetical protein
MDILTLGKISQVKRDTDKKIADLGEVVSVALTATTDNVDQNIALAVCNLNTALADTEQTLTENMATLDTNLSGDLSTLASNTTTSLTNMTNTVSSCMTCINCDVCTAIDANTGSNYGVEYITQFNYCGGDLAKRTCGQQCTWTVPTGVTKATFELWGAGGAGAGSCGTSCCMTHVGAQGGHYVHSGTRNVNPGWTYSICAGGGRCCLTCCRCGCHGCRTCVSGCNVSMCAMGGHGGCSCGSWINFCDSIPICYLCTKSGGGCFSTSSHQGGMSHGRCCHCEDNRNYPTPAPMMGGGVTQHLHHCWRRCGAQCICGHVPVAHGGKNGMTTYCGYCGNTGAPGGPGVVKITYA